MQVIKYYSRFSRFLLLRQDYNKRITIALIRLRACAGWPQTTKDRFSLLLSETDEKENSYIISLC